MLGLVLSAAMGGWVPDARADSTSAFQVDRNPSRDGVYQLSWQTDGPVVVESSEDGRFAPADIVYEGHDLATTISGRSDGVTFYRLVDPETNAILGAPVRVEVRHHPLSRALAFFAVGFLVFAATVALIVTGARSTNPARVDSEADRV